MATHVMTPARRAALKRAQAASARKRRGKGRGKLAAANRQISHGSSRKKRFAKGAAKAVAFTAIAAGAYHASAYANHKATGKRINAARKNRANYTDHSKTRKAKMNHHFGPAARAHGKGPNKSNRVFVTNKYGKTSVRRKYH